MRKRGKEVEGHDMKGIDVQRGIRARRQRGREAERQRGREA